MKKIVFSIGILVLIFSGCIEREEPLPPSLNITPKDTLLTISPISNVAFFITGFSNEDLRKFTIETDPFIYRFDTTFGSFVHEFHHSVEIKLPDQITPFPADSIITVKFTLSDSYNSTVVVKYLKILDPYPDLAYDTVILYYPDRPFYDIATKAILDTTAGAGTYDLVFVFDDQQGLAITSADAPWLSSVFIKQGISYTYTGQRHTVINFTDVNFDDIDKKFLFNLQVNPHYINSNQAYGVGIAHLGAGLKFVFQCESGRKGAGKILDYTLNSITLALKFQKWAAAQKN